MRVSGEYFSKDAGSVAKEILGMLLCVRAGNGTVIKKRITETECYIGEEDTACHAHKGRTNRTEPLYNKGGIAYVYLCYGIHSLLNIVTGEHNSPQAVLIRGIEGKDGPGKLTKFLGIDLSFNKENLYTSDRIWIEDDGTRFSYKLGKRIGIDYASIADREKLWRFTAITGDDKG